MTFRSYVVPGDRVATPRAATGGAYIPAGHDTASRAVWDSWAASRSFGSDPSVPMAILVGITSPSDGLDSGGSADQQCALAGRTLR